MHQSSCNHNPTTIVDTITRTLVITVISIWWGILSWFIIQMPLLKMSIILIPTLKWNVMLSLSSIFFVFKIPTRTTYFIINSQMIKSQFYKLFTSISVFHICFLQVYPTPVPLYFLLQDRHCYTTSSKYVTKLYIVIRVRFRSGLLFRV